MKEIKIITKETVDSAFSQQFRQYFVGELSGAQALEHVADGAIEFGLSRYEEEVLEKPHYHQHLSEYQYIITGEIILYDLDNLTAQPIGAGAFYAIPKGVSHSQLVKAGTEIIFVKNKSLNDKRIVALTAAQHQLIAVHSFGTGASQ